MKKIRKGELEKLAEGAIRKFSLKGKVNICPKARTADVLEIYSLTLPNEDAPLIVGRIQAHYNLPWQQRKWGDPTDNMVEKPWCWLNSHAYDKITFDKEGILDTWTHDFFTADAIKKCKNLLTSYKEVSAFSLVTSIVGDMWNGIALWNSKEELLLHNKEAEDLYHKVFQYLDLGVEEPEWASPFWGYSKTGVSLLDSSNVDDYYHL